MQEKLATSLKAAAAEEQLLCTLWHLLRTPSTQLELNLNGALCCMPMQVLHLVLLNNCS